MDDPRGGGALQLNVYRDSDGDWWANPEVLLGPFPTVERAEWACTVAILEPITARMCASDDDEVRSAGVGLLNTCSALRSLLAYDD